MLAALRILYRCIVKQNRNSFLLNVNFESGPSAKNNFGAEDQNNIRAVVIVANDSRVTWSAAEPRELDDAKVCAMVEAVVVEHVVVAKLNVCGNPFSFTSLEFQLSFESHFASAAALKYSKPAWGFPF